MKKKLQRIKVTYKRLKKYWGLSFSDGTIEIDSRIKGKKHLEILMHESTHVLFPDLTEEEVVEKSIIYMRTLWHEGYRRAEEDNTTPLQDGSI